MKKVFILSIVSVLLLSSCSKPNSPNSSQSTDNPPNISTPENSESRSNIIVYDEEKNTLTLDEDINDSIGSALESLITNDIKDVCKAMERAGVVHGNQTAMAGDMIGAVTGIKYDECAVEIYQFDGNAPDSVELKGFNMAITFEATNKNYGLVCAEAANKDELIEVFNALKFDN